MLEVAVLGQRRFEQCDTVGDPPGSADCLRVVDDGEHHPLAIADLPRQVQCARRVGNRLVGQARIEARIKGGGAEGQLLGRIGRHLERLLEEAQRLDERAERPPPLRGAAECDPGLGRHRLALGTLGLRPVRRDVVLGQRTGDALVVERLEVARRGQVETPSVALRQRAVRNLAHEPLHEPVLPALRRTRVGFHGQHLAPHEPAQVRGDLVGRDAADGGDNVGTEGLADDRCCLEQRPIARLQPVQPGRDERVERGRHGQLGQVADGLGHPALEGEVPIGQEHADGLDRVERDALRALQDALHDRVRQARHEAGQQLAHLICGERLEHEGREVAAPGTPVRAPVEQLRPGEADHVDRAFASPFEDVVDEVEQAVIGPLQVLEDQDHDAVLGDALEEDAPGGEQRVAVRTLAGVRYLEAQELEQARLHPARARPRR